MSKTQRVTNKSLYYIGMESPAVGNYDEKSKTIELDMQEHMKKIHSEKLYQKNLPNLGFNSRVCRFDTNTETEVGPGKYLNEAEIFGSTRVALGKSDRFLDFSEIKKYPGPGSYQVSSDWYKPGFSLLNPRF